jgi:phosphoglycolate phosphatase-like HAD superfamily hydrolase
MGIILKPTLIKNLDPTNVLMVGDGLHDMQSGNAAGVLTCLVKHEWNHNAREDADFLINKLGEIEGIIKEYSE